MEKTEGFTTLAVNMKKSQADEFKRAAQKNNETASSVLRKCVHSYVRENTTPRFDNKLSRKRSGLMVAFPCDSIQELMLMIVGTGKYDLDPNELVDEIILSWFRNESRFHPEFRTRRFEKYLG